MTDSEIPELLQNKLEQVLSLHDVDSDAVSLHHREIGNGPEFAIQAYEGTDLVYESSWYNETEMHTFLEGMDTLDRLQDKL